VGVVIGAQTTNQRELITLAKAAARLGAVAIQMSPPFYHPHTHDDVYDFFAAAAEAADIGVVIYTTYWMGYRMPLDLIGRLAELPNVVAVKWAAPGAYEYEHGLRLFSNRLCMIDNQLQFVLSHMLGARGVNTHPSNYWPEWGVRFWGMLQAGQYREAQHESTRVVSPYYDLCSEVARFTGGEGHLDKLCLELIGLDSSRCRPPTRDIRPMFREKARQMLRSCGVPRCG
jgi:4-hydroxy-tetrahydrodipicolinate synthase